MTDSDDNLLFAQANYKKLFDKNVRIKTIFQPTGIAFFYRAPAEIQCIFETDTAPNTSNFSLGTINKLFTKYVGIYPVTSVIPTTLVINNGDGDLKVSI